MRYLYLGIKCRVTSSHWVTYESDAWFCAATAGNEKEEWAQDREELFWKLQRERNTHLVDVVGDGEPLTDFLGG